MNEFVLPLMILISTSSPFAQGIPGRWVGTVTINWASVPLVFDITENLESQLREMLKNSFKGEFAPKIPDGMIQDEFIMAQINLFTSPWVKYFLR